MKRNAALLLALGLVACGWGRTDPLVWHSSASQAREVARNRCKLVLLLAGRYTCGNCTQMKNVVCENAAVHDVLDANYACWFCHVDESTEWYPYASGLGSFMLPLICVIDPGAASGYLDRSTDTQTVTVFKNRLVSHLPLGAISIQLKSTGPVRLAWGTENKLKYRVLRSGNFATWSFVGSLVTGDGGTAEFADTASGTPARYFYKMMGFK